MKVLLRLAIMMVLFAALFGIAANAQVVDNSSITNKVLCGFQGWFSCQPDGGGYWTHWANDSSWIGPGNYHTEIWPDVREFDPADLFVVPNTTLTQGGTPYLFTDHRQSAINVQFRWMQENGIDGVWLQRFLIGCPRSQESDDILQFVMNACATYGRIFAIEYDTSGTPENEVNSRITQDWNNLKNYFNIENNSRYLHHGGQPVVGVWGMYPDRGAASTYDSVISWFHSNGCKVMGGGPTNWRTEGGGWYNTYRSLDIICPWTVGGYGSSWAEVSNYKNNYIVPDLAECNSRGIVLMPVAWPRFGWDNMNNYPCGTSKFATRGGQHLWDQMYAYKSAGVTCQKIAMFDEYDESTAIMKLSDNVPTSGCWWTTEGKGEDWYLRLANQATKMQRGEIPVSQTIPINSATSPDNAQMISNTIPTTMAPGQQYSVSVTVKNTGETTWPDGNWWKLGAVGESDPFVGGSRIHLPAGVVVMPNQNYTFNFTMTAPVTPGTYTTDWQMVHDPIRWFGGTLSKQVTVSAGTNNASVVSNTIPSTMTAGQQYSVSVTMQNTGGTTWTRAAEYKLGAVGDTDPFAGGRQYLETGDSIAPSGQKTFTFTMTAPSTPGTYTTDWQMVQDGVGWFGGTLTKQVTVSASPVNDAQVISDTIPTTMTAGQQYSVSVTMKNIGSTTWTADGTNAYKLGGAGDSDPFYTVNNPPRILMNAGETVAPNAQRTFTFTMTAPSTPGTYTTDWRMVREWIEWFGGTLSKQVTVNGGPVTISNSTFDSDTNLWTVSLWHSGSYSDGTFAWNSGAGRTGGGMRFIGSGGTDNNDRCNREGGEIQRTISTAGRTGIQVSYDLRVNSMGSSQTGVGAGTCGVDHNDIQEQLTVYYSTNGGTNWTEASNIMRSTLLGYTSYGTRTIDLSGVSACNNNANFRLRFRWQCNSTSDTVDLDNIKVTGI